MRRFIRHPVDMPIEVCENRLPTYIGRPMCNVSFGGLAYYSDHALRKGSAVDVRIPYVQPEFAKTARVAWCGPRAGVFEIGVEFPDEDAPRRTRLLDQVRHIEDYRQYVLNTEGRVLTAAEAAREWSGRRAR